MIAGIIDSTNKAGFWEKTIGEEFEYTIASDVNGLKKCDILLVSEEYCGGAIGTVIADIQTYERFRDVPVAAVTSECSCENQEILLGMGFDDVVRLPISGQLLIRRLRGIAAVSLRESSEHMMNIDSIMEINDGDSGAYCVRSVDFTNIFRFVLRVLERTQKNAQMLVMKLDHIGDKTPAENRRTMSILAESVRKCLRRGDMSSVCGDDRVVILLIGADDEGGHLVASRIVSSFYSKCADDSYELSYDIREVRTTT